MKNEFLEARESADLICTSPQDKNMHWWTRAPMTYLPWEQLDRIPSTDEQFRQLRHNFLRSNPWLSRIFMVKMTGRRVLEIGCGSGIASCLFAERGADVTAIDITSNAAALAQACAGRLGVKVNALQMDAEAMLFPANQFDYVFSWGVIHHSATPEKIVKEIARVLRPGGRGLVMVYHRRSLRYYLRGLQWLFLKGRILTGHTLSTVQRYFTDGYFHRHYSARELKNLLEQNGLSVTEISVTHMGKKMLPLIPRVIDEWLKVRVGWLLIAEFSKGK